MSKEQVMPKNTDEQAQVKVAAEAPAVSDYPLSLDEFCQRLSATDNRVELIGAFHHFEKVAKRMQDTSANYSARFEAFVNQPA